MWPVLFCIVIRYGTAAFWSNSGHHKCLANMLITLVFQRTYTKPPHWKKFTHGSWAAEFLLLSFGGYLTSILSASAQLCHLETSRKGPKSIFHNITANGPPNPKGGHRNWAQRVFGCCVMWRQLQEYLKCLTAAGSLVNFTKPPQTFTFCNDTS